MIGRRELDISSKFLRSFSDPSSSEDEDESVFLQPVSRPASEQVSSTITQHEFHKLSVIEEDICEESVNLQRRRSKDDGNGQPLKLFIPPKKEANGTVRSDTNSPVTPGKYNDNWSQWSSVQQTVYRQTSWCSSPSHTDPFSATPNLTEEAEEAMGKMAGDQLVEDRNSEDRLAEDGRAEVQTAQHIIAQRMSAYGAGCPVIDSMLV